MRCEKVSLFRGTVTFRGWHLHENARKLKKTGANKNSSTYAILHSSTSSGYI